MIRNHFDNVTFDDDCVFTKVYLKRVERLIKGAVNALNQPIKVSELINILGLKMELFEKVTTINNKLRFSMKRISKLSISRLQET